MIPVPTCLSLDSRVGWITRNPLFSRDVPLITKCPAPSYRGVQGVSALLRGLAQPAAMSGACRIPLVNGLFAPPADVADDHVRLRQLVFAERSRFHADTRREPGSPEVMLCGHSPSSLPVL